MGREHDAGEPMGPIYPEHGGRMLLVDLATLCALLPRWIEQTTEHADGFHQWAMRVGEMGLNESARRIEEATMCITACNRALQAALRSLETPLMSLPTDVRHTGE